jgi:putative ABC transport system ATP-binding protein
MDPATSASVLETSVSSGTACAYEAVGLKKDYDGGQVQALRGVDFRIADGEFVAITGPSGCGKTTLLQMLGTLDSPTDGALSYRGRPLSKPSSQSTYRAKEIGFIFQAFHLLPTFTALENVQIPMFEMGWTAAARKDRATALLNSVGLEHRLHHFPSGMSGGERQRVAIARSLANGPSVLLADEPTGNLDSANAAQILELLVRIQREKGMTMVLITHDASIAQRAARIVRMKDGRIVADQISSPAFPS